MMLSPLIVKRGRSNNNNSNQNNNNNQGQSGCDDEEVLSNKSSPGKIQSSQKEIDDFFENFQQQIQVKFLNFEDTVQDCGDQVKKCLNKIFETEVVKEKKQNQTYSARPPSASKKNKLIFLNPFKTGDNLDGTIGRQTINSGFPQPYNGSKDGKQEITTSDFLETLNLAKAIPVQNDYDSFRNEDRNGAFLPTISKGMSNMYAYNAINNRFRAHSINEAVTDQLHRQFIQQRNNCNAGDNIFGIRDHKFERQRILSNETRHTSNLNTQPFNKNLVQNQQIGIVKHPYLNYIQGKEQEQQSQQQQNLMQNLRNAFRVTFNNNNNSNQQNQNHSNEIQKIQNSQQQQLQLKQKESDEPQKQQLNIFGDLTKQNTVQTPTMRNSNVKVFKRKDKSFRPSWNDSNQKQTNNVINLNNNSFANASIKLSTDNNNNNNIVIVKENLTTTNSQQILQQLSEIQSHRINGEGVKTYCDNLENSLLGKLDTQITQGSFTNIRYKIRYDKTAIQTGDEAQFENRTNPYSDKPKKKVIKISKESVFCKIIQEQKEKQIQKKEENALLMGTTKIRSDHTNKQKSHDFQDLKLQSLQNQNFQIYQDQNLLQQYMGENQSLQQKVKMFKFTKKISNKTENDQQIDKSYQGITQILQDKENVSQNILNNISQIEKNIATNEVTQPLKRTFKRNISFHRKNRSLNNEGVQKQPSSSLEQQQLLLQKENEQNNQLIQPDMYSQLNQDDQQKSYKFIPSNNNQYDIDEIRSSLFLKKSNSSEHSGKAFLKNQLQNKQSEIGSNKKICNENLSGQSISTKTLNDIINSYNYQQQSAMTKVQEFKYLANQNLKRMPTFAKVKQNKQEGNDQTASNKSLYIMQQSNNNSIQTQNNLYNIDPSNDKHQHFLHGTKHNGAITFNSILNNHNNQKKKFFGLNLQIEDMIIQNIDEFKQKVVNNQQ